jgi:RNA polymerase sigma-70 factor (ECF subfamily)
MDDPSPKPDRLSRISTFWSMVREAQQGAPGAAADAQVRLLQRYSRAVRHYLLGALRDPDAAEELYQEFFLRFVRGDFKNANPQRGRFRDFVKTVLFHLIVDHQRRRRSEPRPLGADVPEPIASPAPDPEREFTDRWRHELLRRAWAALAEVERQTGRPLHTVLRLKIDQPSLSSAELAERFAARLGKRVTVDGLRQALHRARERFADLLLAEVAHSLQHPSREELEQELIDLRLLPYCQPALKRRGGP